METTGKDLKVLVVAESDRLSNLARKTIAKLGSKLRGIRAVKAAVKRFGDRIAANPSPLRIEVLDVVGFCGLVEDRPRELEPIVIHEGKPPPVSSLYLIESGDYWVGTPAQLEEGRAANVAPMARKIAEDLIVCEAMSMAVEEADGDGTLSGWSLDPATRTVELDGDDDGKIARRLPEWIHVEARETK